MWNICKLHIIVHVTESEETWNKKHWPPTNLSSQATPQAARNYLYTSLVFPSFGWSNRFRWFDYVAEED